MMSHSYATDAQTKSADLAATIVAAATPPEIATACTAVEAFLHKHSPDQSRWFFSLTFPTLICKIFGFDEQNPQKNPNGNGWIDVLTSANDSDASGKLLALLSPTGVLMSSITAVDRLSLVKYVFPIERLPEWVRLTLQNARECSVLCELCPLFKGRLKDGVSFPVQLNILEYYLFWFAYYPVCRGSSPNRARVGSGTSKRFRLESWACKAIPVFGSSGSKPRGNERKNDDDGGGGGGLYVRILNDYLRFFVPLSDLNNNTHSPYRSSLLHYSASYNSSVLENAEFFVHTLIHFWIVDNDFSPLSVKVCKSFGVVLPLRSILAEVPPTSGLGEVVNVFVKYLNSSLVPNAVEGCDQVELYKTTVWRGDLKSKEIFSGMGSVGYWNSCIQRPLYRYILRTFMFCPVETSAKSVSQVFSLWVNYMEPWAVRLGEVSEVDVKAITTSQPQEYSSAWQGFVLSNYLFYSSLVMHFIGFAHKFIHTDPEVIVQMVSKVVNILTSSRELVDLIKNVDTVFHSIPAGSSKSMLNTLYRFVPSIREQLQDWEDGLSETDADGSFLHENWNKDLKLFSTSEDSGQQLLQLLALRAESELQATSRENLPNNLQLLSSLKARMGSLFGGNLIRSPSLTAEGKQSEKPQHHEIFRPRTAGNRPTTDIRYKGDWMKRPISNDEVAWLANLLVRLSWWLNEILGLNPWEENNGHASWSYVEVSGGDAYGAKDTMRLVWSWVMKFMREHGMRVNLRILASKKVVTVVVIAVAFSVLKRMFLNYFRLV